MARGERRQERGAILAAAGLGLLAFFAITAVAIDVGRLAFTATEVQNVADIAATAGATAAYMGEDHVAAAQNVVALNSVDGAAASIAAGDVIIGSYDLQTQTFSPGGTPSNAVQANAMATVNNILASIFGTPTTTVNKTATAAFTTVGGATPELPIAIGSCYFENLPPDTLPPLVQVPSNDSGNANNTAFTAFFDTANAMTIENFIPAPCGGNVAIPEVSVGDNITLNNGQIANIFNNFQCLLDNNIREFVIPIVQSSGSTCGGPINQTSPVTGFVTLVIDSVNGMGSPKYINLHAIKNSSVPGTPGGCPTCGSGFVVLVN